MRSGGLADARRRRRGGHPPASTPRHIRAGQRPRLASRSFRIMSRHPAAADECNSVPEDFRLNGAPVYTARNGERLPDRVSAFRRSSCVSSASRWPADSRAAPSSRARHPDVVTVQAFVRPQGDRLRLLVRVPLGAMRDVEFPLRGDGLLDFRAPTRPLRDAALLWLAKDIAVYEGGTPLGRAAARGVARLAAVGSIVRDVRDGARERHRAAAAAGHDARTGTRRCSTSSSSTRFSPIDRSFPSTRRSGASASAS